MIVEYHPELIFPEQINRWILSNPNSQQDLRYTYDPNGNVLTIQDYKAGNPQTQTFTYDELDRLTSGVASGGSGGLYALQNYTYNGTTGNLSSKAGVNYTYGDNLHRHAVTLMGTDTFTYDANGNQITRSVGGNSYTLSYDAENRLVGVSRPKPGQVTGAASATFVYDGDGNRVKGTIAGVTTTYVGNYYEWTGSTSTMKSYYYAGSTRVAMRTGSNTLNYLLGDHLGSQAITTDSSGGKTAEIRYYPWGTERYTSGTTPTTYHFTGQRLESSIGLYYYGARWYDPAAGRFVQADTDVPDSQGVQGLDRYAYVNNSPVNYTDPSGHMMTECGQDNHECNKTAGEEYSDYVYNVLHNEEERRENTEKVETAGQILGAIGSVAVEPVDWALTAGECLGGDCSPLALLGLLPLIPGSSIDDIIDVVKKLDGQKVLTNDILDLAANFLGKDYIDMGNGRFLSADGLRQVRMGIGDIADKIPHVNFEILKPIANMPGRYDVVDNVHIVIAEMFK